MTRRPRGYRPRIQVKDVHCTKSFRTNFLASLSEQIDRLVICSPYFGELPSPFNSWLSFFSQQEKRGVGDIKLVVRPPGSDAQALPVDTAKALAALGVEIFVRTSPYLHSKIYHFEYQKGFFRTFVGSSNFTKGGLKRNYEVVAEIEGVGTNSPCHREIARMLHKGALPYPQWARENFK